MSPADPLETTSNGSAQRPVARPDERSAGYWMAIAQGRLEVQRCTRCRHWQHPPAAACEACHSPELGYEGVNGTGVIHQRVIVHQTKLVGFENSTPYAAATVELDEQQGLFVVGGVIGPAPDQVFIGQRVHVVFTATPDGLTANFAPGETRNK